jgi:hypothetical protein
MNLQPRFARIPGTAAVGIFLVASVAIGGDADGSDDSGHDGSGLS